MSRRSSSSRSPQILHLEDDRFHQEAVKTALQSRGCYVVSISNIHEAYDAAINHRFDLMILDRHLPDGDGLQMLHDKTLLDQTRVIVVSSKIKIEDRLEAYAVHVDDYLVKPFDQRELLAKVESLLRRGRQQERSEVFWGPLHLDMEDSCLRNLTTQSVLTLQPMQTRFLEVLMRANGRVVQKESMMRAVWTVARTPSQATVDVTLSRLRKALSQVAPQILIQSRYGQGYSLVEAVEKKL